MHHLPSPDIEVMHGGPDQLACPRLESDIFLEVQRLAAVADLHMLLTMISCSETMPVFFHASEGLELAFFEGIDDNRWIELSNSMAGII